MTTLRDPFPTVHKKNIKNKLGEVAAQVDYIEWADAADRLDEAEPGWSFAIVSLGEDWCHGRLTFPDGRSFENVGYAENADQEWKKEPLKDAVSDALKRCAALAGVARYLYNKTPQRPAVSSPAAASVGAAGRMPRPAAPTVPPEPEYLQEWPESADDEGTCPQHGKPWRENSRGFYCATKNGDGSWCDEKPTQRWKAARSK